MTQSDNIAKELEAAIFAAILGPPRKQQQTALRVRNNTFETVRLDDAGNVIERCCYGTVLHAPNCKYWFTCT